MSILWANSWNTTLRSVEAAAAGEHVVPREDDRTAAAMRLAEDRGAALVDDVRAPPSKKLDCCSGDITVDG